MSLILEALRKSEAERRRGEAPGLRVELPPVAAATRHTLPAWIWIAGAALVLVLVLIALWPRGSGSPSGTGVRDGNGDRLSSDGADLISAPMDRGPTRHDRVPATTAPSIAGSPATSSTGTPTAVDSDAFPQVERITPPAPAARNSPPPPTNAEPGVMPAPTTTTIDAEAASAPAPETGPVETSPRVPDETADPALASRPATPRASNAPRITELNAPERQRLPAMKLTMHMWNEDPTRRFVVIDGQRKAEGDRVGEATIGSIDRDGVLLELDGRPIRVPLP